MFSNSAQHGDPPTHPPTVKKSRTGAEQRLKDIRDALAEKVASERRPFGQSKENIPPATPQLRVNSLRGREKRLREIQDALAGLEVVSKTTSGSTTVSILSAKRPSEPSIPPPTAKRRRLRSTHEPVVSALPASIFPTPVSTTVQPTDHASVSLNIWEKQPEELREKVHHRVAQTPQLRDADCHIDEFFAQYPQFPYDPCASVMAQFYRMCNFFGWKLSTTKEVGCREIDDADRSFRVARQAFNDAIARQFNSIYGTDFEDISSWKNLCRALGIIPIPKGLRECRDAVAAAHVNIVDLVETRTTGKPVELFESEEELSAYTRKSGKFFPRNNASAGGLLKFLLRHILNPSQSRGRRDA